MYSPTTWVEKVSKVGPTLLNKLELGLQAAAVVADAALPTPAGSNGQFLKRIAGVWTPASLAATDIAGFSVLSSQAVLEAGVSGQCRAGRVLAATDFTTLLGLSAPVGLYNLSDTSDASGNARSLTNQGTVTFGSGIMGAATEAAIFTGSTAQALYIADAGGSDPFRIGYGSVGCWFRTAKKGTTQGLVTKDTTSSPTRVWQLSVASNDVVQWFGTSDGTTQLFTASGTTTVTDDRWHHVCCTWDGAVALVYLDGVLESVGTGVGPLAVSVAAPFNIGGYGANAGTAASFPHYGRVDEAFVTSDILSPDQIRMLYAAKVAHGFGATPKQAAVVVRRRRKGAAYAASDFSATPKYLYNFTGAALTDAGSLGNALTNNSASFCPAPDGSQLNAASFSSGSSSYFSATDTGLPAGTSARSFGAWVKTASATAQTIMSWGTSGAGTEMLFYITAAGLVTIWDGSAGVASPSLVDDAIWHYVVGVQDNAAADGLKTKLYIDGKLVASSTSMIASGLVLGGSFRIGREVGASTNYMNGQIDGVFVTNYAMTGDEVGKLYAVGSLSLGISPKNSGDHLEGIDGTNVYLVCDSLDSQHQIDLEVAA